MFIKKEELAEARGRIKRYKQFKECSFELVQAHVELARINGIQYRWGALSFFDIIFGKNSYRGCATKLPELIKQGELLIADFGYFCLQSLKNIADSGAYFIFRFLVGTTLLVT